MYRCGSLLDLRHEHQIFFIVSSFSNTTLWHRIMLIYLAVRDFISTVEYDYEKYTLCREGNLNDKFDFQKYWVDRLLDFL
jgi:hypothetical protein